MGKMLPFSIDQLLDCCPEYAFPLASSYPCYREPTERDNETGYPAFTSGNYASDDGWMTIAEKGYHHHPPPPVINGTTGHGRARPPRDHRPSHSLYIHRHLSDLGLHRCEHKVHNLAILRRPAHRRSGFDYPLSTTPATLRHVSRRRIQPYLPSTTIYRL